MKKSLLKVTFAHLFLQVCVGFAEWMCLSWMTATGSSCWMKAGPSVFCTIYQHLEDSLPIEKQQLIIINNNCQRADYWTSAFSRAAYRQLFIINNYCQRADYWTSAFSRAAYQQLFIINNNYQTAEYPTTAFSRAAYQQLYIINFQLLESR